MKGRDYELTIDEIDGIFKQLKKLDAVRITGGEPFAREDISEIINVIQNRNKPNIIHITTNGLLGDKILDLFTKVNMSSNIHIKISINAFGKEHDRVMGLDGAFDMALNTLKRLVGFRSKYKFFVGVNQTITSRAGMDDYGKLKKICDEYKVDLFPVLAYAKTALYAQGETLDCLPKKPGEFNIFVDFTKDELKIALARLINDASKISDFKERIVKQYYLKGAYNRLILGKVYPAPACTELNDHLRILPNGDVPMCLYNSNIAGNLTKQPFKELWFGDAINKHRVKVRSCPICWASCEIIPNAVYTGDLARAFFI
jgi:MoaA/NifB/PqqE/SkfB family radical SAM enzyme